MLALCAKTKQEHMLALLTSATVLSPSFRVHSLDCIDHGKNQRYCPDDPLPFYNDKYVPKIHDIHVRRGVLSPGVRREASGEVGLSFHYDVDCRRYDSFWRCVSGDVRVHVQPSPKWDRYVNIWLEILVFTILAIFVSPIILVFLFLGFGGVPSHKEGSYFDD